MVYTHSQSIDIPDVPPGTLWSILSDPVYHHPRWDVRVKKVSLDGAFVDGVVQWISFTFAPQPVRTVLVDVLDGVGYSDDVDIFGIPTRFTHRIDPDGSGGSRVTFSVRLEGPRAQQAGPGVSGNLPNELAALARYARTLG
ncbi:SRPBCC family protein [Longispora sp. NPDC051575]|uniref:SRPBCC family protein n=1 Tax=Longispora sp. NPDC051575 TaxID=3154943 RepID=UPI00343963FA